MIESSPKKHIPKNLIYNIISFLINVFVGLWLVPYLVNILGESAYGLIPLAMLFTEYISVIAVSINGSISRFLTIDIQKKNWTNANKTFNTAFFALLGLILVQLIILGYITIDVNTLLNIPNELLIDSYYLFAFTFLGYLISLVSSVFSTSMYAYNRLDLILKGNITRTIIRTITIIVLFITIEPSLIIVGISNLLGSIIIFLYSFYYWKTLTPNFKINYNFYDKSRLKGLLGMGGWLIVNQVGYLLFLKIDLFVINKYFGANSGGRYAAVLQWSSLIRTMSGILSGVLGPMILISYANGDIKSVIKYAKVGVKYLSIAVGLITGIICGFSFEILTLWLGTNFSDLALLLIIMLSHLTINLGVLPLLPINTAFNKVKIPGIVTFIMGLLNLILAIFFASYTDMGLLGIALAGLIVLSLKNGIFSPWYASKILKIKSSTFFTPLIGGIIIFICSILFTTLLKNIFIIDNWISLTFFGVLISLISIYFVWIFILNTEEKLFAKNLIKQKFNVTR